MTAIPKWAPATTYAPGALVVPRSSAPPAFTGLDNPKLTDTTGWDLDSPLAILADGQGYAGEGRIACQGTSNQATGKNQAHIPVNPGQTVGVSAMCAHGTSDKHSSDGLLYLHWYKSDDTEIGTPTSGSGLPSLSNAGWQQLSVSGTAPSGVAYCRIGFGVYRHGTDTIQISHFTLNYTPQAPVRATMYEATQAKPGKSAGTEPIWPPLGESVQDNEVTWNGVNIDRIVWQASPLLESGDTEPDWPTAPGGAVHDGTIDWVAVVPYITDPNCPNTPTVAIMASKVFAADKDIVRFCATANALDWTSQQDAGYLPTGLQQSNSNDMAVLAPYRGNLTAFNASCFQNWQVDPDPAAMALLDQMEGIGSIYQRAARPVGNELYFLSALGVRSVSIAAGSDNLQSGDIGMPVDSLIQAALANLADVDPLAMYYPSAGQYWLAIRPTDLTIGGDLPNGVVGDTGTYQYTIRGGVLPRTVESASGALPDGATMDSKGLVTYAYTTAGDFSWTVKVTDADGNVAQVDDSATISDVGIACGIASSYGGGQAFPNLVLVTLGSATGSVTLKYATGPNPDKMEVWIGGVKVVDTGYHGSPDQINPDTGNTYQTDLSAYLAANGLPDETITQIPGPANVVDANTQFANNPEFATFNKTTADATATVKIYSPLGNTIWKFSLSCPGT